LPLNRSFSSPEDSRSAARRADESPDRERLIPFPTRLSGDTEPRTRQPRRRPAVRDPDAPASMRRPRRRRHNAPWLQRNALSIAGLSVLVALLAVGFGVVQVLTRPDTSQALLPVTALEQSPMMTAASVANVPATVAFSPATPAVREIQAAARVIEPNYTVEAGDTLGRIAARYNTSVERIQAFNNIADARALRIGARLVIPPPL
jgi:hypothetical protein